MRFIFNEPKAVAALGFVARKNPGLTPFYVSKVFFYAEKKHFNMYGRPIVADTYIAMPQGPVPSTIKNYIDENWNWVSQPETIAETITIQRTKGRLPKLMPGKAEPSLDLLSESDIECLSEAIEFCKNKSTYELSRLTHFERAYVEAEPNHPMDLNKLIDENNPNKEKILARVAESSPTIL